MSVGYFGGFVTTSWTLSVILVIVRAEVGRAIAEWRHSEESPGTIERNAS